MYCICSVDRCDLAIVTVGSNDVLGGVPVETFARNLDATLAATREHATRVVVPTLPLGLAAFPGSRRVLRERVQRYNEAIASQENALVVDGSDLSGAAMSLDRVHPTVAGQRMLAERALALLGDNTTLPGDPGRERTAGVTVTTAARLAAKSLLRRY